MVSWAGTHCTSKQLQNVFDASFVCKSSLLHGTQAMAYQSLLTLHKKGHENWVTYIIAECDFANLIEYCISKRNLKPTAFPSVQKAPKQTAEHLKNKTKKQTKNIGQTRHFNRLIAIQKADRYMIICGEENGSLTSPY